jgi:hypothetical protein
MALPDVTTALSSRLRSLHLAIVRDLGKTFQDDHVRAHSAEVTPDTVKRFIQGKYALWAVVASADGLEESLSTELRMGVRWGVFVIAGALHEVPDPENDPTRKREVPAVQVAETLANLVARLANQRNWGVEGCDGCRADSIAIRNLGVGIKSTQGFVEREDIGLFVVWGTNDLAMGPGIAPGDEQLPQLGAMIGSIVDHSKENERPEIEVNLTEEFVGLVGRAWAWIRRWFGPSWHEQAAAAINAEMREMLNA